MNTMDLCPHCQSTNIIKHGFYKSRRRYFCRGCLKTFSNKIHSVSYHSKKSDDVWDLYITLFNTGCTIKECANMLEINLKTSFFWRHKILAKISEIQDNRVLNNLIGIKTLKFLENRKGQKNITSPRRIFYLGLVCSSKNDLSGKLLFTSPFQKIKATNTFIEKIKFVKKPLFIGFDLFSRSISLQLNRILKKRKTNHPIDSNMINLRLISSVFKLHRWKKRFHGIATKYFELYFQWYSCLDAEKYIKDFYFKDILNGLLIAP